MSDKAKFYRWGTNLLVITFIVVMMTIIAANDGEGANLFLPLLLFLILPFGKRLMRRSRQHECNTADEILSTDSRDPVLYLRPFRDDEHTSNFEGLRTDEEQLSEVMNKIGPFVAIGCPGETLPKGGAARVYVGDNEWQARVINFIQRSSLIVMRVGYTDAVFWELEQIIHHTEPTRLLILIDDDADTAAYTTFRKRANTLLPIPLPEKLERAPKKGLSHILYFDSDWNPTIDVIKRHWLRSGYYHPMVARYTLAMKPIFEQLNIEWKKPRLKITRLLQGMLIGYVCLVVIAILLPLTII